MTRRQESVIITYSHRIQTEDGRRRFWECSEELARCGVRHLIDCQIVSPLHQVVAHFEDYDRAVDPGKINLLVMDPPLFVDPEKLYPATTMTVTPHQAGNLFVIYCRLVELAANIVLGVETAEELANVALNLERMAVVRDDAERKKRDDQEKNEAEAAPTH